MATALAALDTTQYVKINNSQRVALIQCTRDAVRVAFSNVQPAKSNTVFHLLTADQPPLKLDGTDTDIWVLSLTDTSNVVITDFPDLAPVIGDTFDDITRGTRSDVNHYRAIAHKTGAATASGEQTIWEESTDFTPMSASDTFTITYNSTNDGADAGATGALTLLITYIDASETIQQDTHTLSDTGSDVTSFSGFGVNSVEVSSSGSSDTNVNDITIAVTTSGDVQAFVPASASVTQQAVFSVPDAVTPVMQHLSINTNRTSAGAVPKIVFKGYAYNRATDTKREIFKHTVDVAIENTLPISTAELCAPITARDVIWFVMDTDADSTNATLTFSLNLYDD